MAIRLVVSELCQRYPAIQFLTFEQPMPTTKAAADVLQCDESSVIKTCIVRAKSNYSAVILQGTDQIDTKKLQAILGKTQFAKAEQVQEATGYIAGGVPPIGFGEGLSCVVIDTAVFEHESVYGGGGTKETLLKICPALIKSINEEMGIHTQIQDIRK